MCSSICSFVSKQLVMCVVTLIHTISVPKASFQCVSLNRHLNHAELCQFAVAEVSVVDFGDSPSYMEWDLLPAFNDTLKENKDETLHIMFRTRDPDGIIFSAASFSTLEHLKLEVCGFEFSWLFLADFIIRCNWWMHSVVLSLEEVHKICTFNGEGILKPISGMQEYYINVSTVLLSGVKFPSGVSLRPGLW